MAIHRSESKAKHEVDIKFSVDPPRIYLREREQTFHFYIVSLSDICEANLRGKVIARRYLYVYICEALHPEKPTWDNPFTNNSSEIRQVSTEKVPRDEPKHGPTNLSSAKIWSE